jgi:hypothetical protein
MLLLLGSISFQGIAPDKTDGSVYACRVPVAARYDYFSNFRVYACISASTRSNLNVWNIQCESSSIGITISDIKSYEYSGFYSDGRKWTVAGCSYRKNLAYVFGGTSCWVEATISTKWYGGATGWGTSISAPRSNYC